MVVVLVVIAFSTAIWSIVTRSSLLVVIGVVGGTAFVHITGCAQSFASAGDLYLKFQETSNSDDTISNPRAIVRCFLDENPFSKFVSNLFFFQIF